VLGFIKGEGFRCPSLAESDRLNPLYTRVIVIVVVIVAVVAGVSFYYYRTHVTSTCGLKTTNPLIFDQPEHPDSLDPAVVFTTPGWGIVQQVYQTLVMYNGSSATSFNGLLAKNWTSSNNGSNWNFTMWSGEHFSNGDPINAYVMWYSFYRGLVMGQPLVFLQEENFYVPGQTYYSNLTAIQAENKTLANQLNTFNFFAPTPSEISVMTAPNQSVRVINATTIQFNIGAGYLGVTTYPYVLDQIAAPDYSAIDPKVVDANGGVSVGAPSTWASTNMLGSGPFVLTSFNQATGYTLSPNPDYWATGIAAKEPWNNAIQPAKAAVQISFQASTAIEVNDLKTGAAAAGSFAYIGPSTINQLKGFPCVSVTALPPVYGATSFSGWIYMNQQVQPFNNWSFRAAVVHAIDYPAIKNVAYGGYATQWVGPVPAGFPDDNNATAKLPYYQYDAGLAQQEVNASPWPLSKGGYSGMTGKTLNFMYIAVGTDLYNAALIIQQNLKVIGLNVVLKGLSLQQEAAIEAVDPSTGVCVSDETTYGGPFYIGESFYTADYVSPDDATQGDALSYGFYNVCQSEYANTTVVDPNVTAALAATSPAVAAQIYGNITRIMYYNYTDAWLFIPTAFAVQSTALKGVVLNPMGSGLPFTMVMNTEYA
jgi:peptide/nickel transport system substrate-binding protein